MKTETVNRKVAATNWGETIHLTDGYLFSAHVNPHGDYDNGLPCENDRQNAELIVTAVNACKEINKDNPLKVALGLPQLFKRLDEVMNDKRLDWGLYGELAAIVDTLKSNF